MDRSSEIGDGRSSDLLVDIVETLEECGLDGNSYQLYDVVDVEALEQLLNSASDDVEVRFTVEGIRLAVTPERLDVITDDDSRAADR